MTTHVPRPHNLRPLLLSLLLTQLAFGCSNNTNVGENHDGGADARVRTGPYDECGNGMDDDGDGQIDEDCFCGGGETQPCFTGMYPNRGVGACADGVQTCDATSSTEFGHWGACTMDTLPTEETCDGVDNNCNGAIDEGCPCTAGETRACAEGFSSAPCSPGTQTCQTDGTWSACEGAIGPSAEACGPGGAGDGVDNDCDGMTDEGCTCVPEPEVCGDGVDNDCDGEIDEAACTPSMTLPDACVAGPVEICGDSIDNDCDGDIDELDCTVSMGLDGGVDLCAEHTCSGHGTCAVLPDETLACACIDGYRPSGLSCVADDPMCQKKWDALYPLTDEINLDFTPVGLVIDGTLRDPRSLEFVQHGLQAGSFSFHADAADIALTGNTYLMIGIRDPFSTFSAGILVTAGPGGGLMNNAWAYSTDGGTLFEPTGGMLRHLDGDGISFDVMWDGSNLTYSGPAVRGSGGSRVVSEQLEAFISLGVADFSGVSDLSGTPGTVHVRIPEMSFTGTTLLDDHFTCDSIRYHP